jgi:outer membrane scaffolding protein for murein synthesis (MipA/OmpV family)
LAARVPPAISASAKARLLGLLLAAGTTAAAAEKLPLWEAGAGVAVVNFPDYRGSDERTSLALPVPYFIYRGEKLRVDRDSVRGRLFESERMELDLSVNGSIPVDSDDNEAREGMPDLKPTIEIGPALQVHLLENKAENYRLDFRWPVRAVFNTDLDHTGWLTHPKLNLDLRNPFGYQEWKLGASAGPLFADRKYHGYFYDIAPRFATVDRPAFDADNGYAGSSVLVAVSRRFPKWWVGGFLRWDTLDGAAFEDSPLVRDERFFTAGIAISRIFEVSETLVETSRPEN